MRTEIKFAGFGGQGILLSAKLLAYAAMKQGSQVAWIPSYGPEMRGGTAYCSVMVSDTPVGSPIINDDATCVIVMNQPSLVKFEHAVAAGGILLLNSSLIETEVTRKDIKTYSIQALDLATECGNGQAFRSYSAHDVYSHPSPATRRRICCGSRGRR